jgi:hypothetical protein
MCTTHRCSSTSSKAKLGNPSPTCFAMKQAIGCQHVSSHHPYLLIGFEAQTDKPPPTCFWGPNQLIVMVILSVKSPNRSYRFGGPNWKPERVVLRPNHKNRIHQFWGQTIRTVSTSFEVKLGETIYLGFEAKKRNSCSSCSCGRCRPHIASPNLLIVWPPSTRLALHHPQSSAPSILLLPWSSLLPAMPHLSPSWYKQTCFSTWNR